MMGRRAIGGAALSDATLRDLASEYGGPRPGGAGNRSGLDARVRNGGRTMVPRRP